MSRKEERMPPLRIQYEQGYKAFYMGWLVNNYNKDSLHGKEWQRGFDTAYFDNLAYLTKQK
jgi:hypothetical protein